MPPLRILSAQTVDTISSTFSPTDLQCLMARVFHAVSRGSKSTASPPPPLGDTSDPSDLNKTGAGSITQVPLRTSITTPHHVALFMPAHLGGGGGGTAIKVVSVPQASGPGSSSAKGGGDKGLPATTLVLDDADGSVKAVVNARALTALRNAAGSLLSTCLLTTRTPRHIVAFGAGNQIHAHLALHIQHFMITSKSGRNVQKCTIVNRTLNTRFSALLTRLSASFPNVTFTGLTHDEEDAGIKVKTALYTADLVICATPSSSPLFPAHWVRAGTHVVLVGSYKPTMHEVDTALILRANPVLVDARAACLAEAGEIIQAQLKAEELTEIGEVLPVVDGTGELDLETLEEMIQGKVKKEGEGEGEVGRTGEELGDFEGPVTLFKSVGIGLQDVAIAAAVVAKAEEEGLGVVIDDYDI